MQLFSYVKARHKHLNFNCFCANKCSAAKGVKIVYALCTDICSFSEVMSAETLFSPQPSFLSAFISCACKDYEHILIDMKGTITREISILVLLWWGNNIFKKSLKKVHPLLFRAVATHFNNWLPPNLDHLNSWVKSWNENAVVKFNRKYPLKKF